MNERVEIFVVEDDGTMRPIRAEDYAAERYLIDATTVQDRIEGRERYLFGEVKGGEHAL